jgi:hypothetical protein
MIIACRAIGVASQNRHGEIAFAKLGRKKPASESMGRTERHDVHEHSPADFEMRPEAGPMASSIPISKWQAAVRKPDNPPAPSDLSGMM